MPRGAGGSEGNGTHARHPLKIAADLTPLAGTDPDRLALPGLTFATEAF